MLEPPLAVNVPEVGGALEARSGVTMKAMAMTRTERIRRRMAISFSRGTDESSSAAARPRLVTPKPVRMRWFADAISRRLRLTKAREERAESRRTPPAEGNRALL